MTKRTWSFLLPCLLILSGCNPVERLQAGLQALTGEDHPHHEHEGHEHDDHGHDHAPGAGGNDEHAPHPVTLTHFSPVTELHVEFMPLAVGEPSRFAVHLSHLSDGSPVKEGTVTVSLVGGGAPPEFFTAPVSDTPGIFLPVVMPKEAAWRQLTISLASDKLNASHLLGEYGIHPTRAEAFAATPHEDETEGAITYTKEQQWQVAFNTVAVSRHQLRTSIIATGSIRPRADGEVYLSAASTGHIRAEGRFPYPGMRVERGQLLATIAPHLAADSDLSTLSAALDKAQSTYNLAKHERERLEKLWRDKVVAAHRLHEADTALQLARTELETAQRRYRQSTGQEQTAGSGIPIHAPIAGVIADVNTAAGKYVNEGESLFHIVDIERLWLEARIAEADIAGLREPAGAWFTISGFERPFDTFELGGQMVAFGGLVDPVSRTAPLIFEFDNPQQRLRPGMFANARLFTGESVDALAVPASAIFDDGGQDVVYVMLDGEHFQRRPVRLGVREGDWVQLRSGVAAGERVVSPGAYLLRLASASPTEAGHGHAH